MKVTGSGNVETFLECTQMKTIQTQCISAIVALAITSAMGRADEPKSGAKDDNNLIGTWKLVSAKWGGVERKNEGLTILKHVTPAQFMWVRYDKDGNLKHAMGGAY